MHSAAKILLPFGAKSFVVLTFLFAISTPALARVTDPCPIFLSGDPTLPSDLFWRAKSDQISARQAEYARAVSSAEDPSSPELRRLVQARSFTEQTLASILNRRTFITADELDEPLTPSRPALTLATLLRLLSQAPRGRELIDAVWPVLASMSNRTDFKIVKWSEEIKQSGRLSQILENGLTTNRIEIRQGLPLGLGVFVLAHELLHLYDESVLALKHSPDEPAAEARLEARAFRFEQIILRELTQHSPGMQAWIKLNPPSLKEIRNMNQQTFAENLFRRYGIPRALGLAAPWDEVSLTPPSL